MHVDPAGEAQQEQDAQACILLEINPSQICLIQKIPSQCEYVQEGEQ